MVWAFILFNSLLISSNKMIASSSFEASGTFDLQMVAAFVIQSLQLQTSWWYNHCLFFETENTRNQVQPAKSTARSMLIGHVRENFSKPCAHDIREQTRHLFHQRCNYRVRCMHDYQLLWKWLGIIWVEIVAYQSRLGWEDEDGQEKTLLCQNKNRVQIRLYSQIEASM